MKLLFAEDEASLSEAVVDILTYHNYQVDAVYDGADALAYAREIGCTEVTLNVWEGNDSALAFYRRMGFAVRKTTMEWML